jgi:YfiH family protein
MQCDPADILAWLGPAIGPQAFEVGEEVREAFVRDLPAAAAAFTPHASGLAPNHYLADIYQLARLRLARAGVHEVYGGGLCTYADVGRFYSYRRDKATGRMASLIWLG